MITREGEEEQCMEKFMVRGGYLSSFAPFISIIGESIHSGRTKLPALSILAYC